MLLAKSLVVLCSAAVTMALSTPNALASGLIFVGKNTADACADALDVFREPKNLADAVSSVMAFSAHSTGFLPSEVPPKSLVPALDGFIQKISTFPGFAYGQTLDQSIGLTGNLTQLEQVIRNADQNVQNLAIIGRAIRDLVPGYIPEADLTHWILSLVAIEKPSGGDRVSFQVVRVTLDLKTDNHHTTYIPKQSARLVVSDFSVNGNFFISNAETLANKIPIVRVHDTIDLLTSPVLGSVNIHQSAPCHKNPFDFESRVKKQSLLNW